MPAHECWSPAATSLADMAPPEAAQEGAQSLPSRKRGVEGSLSRETEHAGGPAGAQRSGVVDAVAPQLARRPPASSACRRCRLCLLQAQVQAPVNQLGRPRRRARVAGRTSPALATRR